MLERSHTWAGGPGLGGGRPPLVRRHVSNLSFFVASVTFYRSVALIFRSPHPSVLFYLALAIAHYRSGCYGSFEACCLDELASVLRESSVSCTFGEQDETLACTVYPLLPSLAEQVLMIFAACTLSPFPFSVPPRDRQASLMRYVLQTYSGKA